MNIKKLWLKFKQRVLPASFTSDDMIQYLKLCGIRIGEGCRFYRPSSMNIDVTSPVLLEIGSYVKITSGVVILAHDYSRSVIRRAYGEVIGEARKTMIGDNVFVGMNAIILNGANIGNNVIIGAGSVVSGQIPDNSVVAGNPAKVIMSLEEYYKRRKSNYITEAKNYIRMFIDYNNREPVASEMRAFWPLFVERDREELKRLNIRTKLGGDNEEEVIRDFLNTEKVYLNLNELIEEAKSESDQSS